MEETSPFQRLVLRALARILLLQLQIFNERRGVLSNDPDYRLVRELEAAAAMRAGGDSVESPDGMGSVADGNANLTLHGISNADLAGKWASGGLTGCGGQSNVTPRRYLIGSDDLAKQWE